MKFIVEHMEPEISEWVELEYENIKNHVGKENFILCGTKDERYNSVGESIENWGIDYSRVLLLDPKATQELSPADAQFDYLLFGGILGDDPPQDRTGLLRRLGFQTRHLGPVQMTTDTGFSC